VAKLAGVSKMTVSNVLNNKPVVHPGTRETVLQAIKALNYTPNEAARALANSESLRIGLLHSDVDSALLSAILVGTLRATSRLGVQLVVDTFDPIDPLSGVEHFMMQGLNGLLLPPPLCEIVSASGFPERYNAAMMALAPGGELANMGSVRIDDEKASYALTQLLLEKGHRKIGFVGIPGALVAISRLRGYLRALGDFGVSANMDYVWQAPPTFSAGLDLAREALSGTRDVTAILAANDDMAAAFVNMALQRGLSIPRDISIIGFDDSPIAVKIWPALTTVRQPLAQIAERATERLVNSIRDSGCSDAEANATTYVNFTVIERESVGEVVT
jgi:LacI family transcriptional regulator